MHLTIISCHKKNIFNKFDFLKAVFYNALNSDVKSRDSVLPPDHLETIFCVLVQDQDQDINNMHLRLCFCKGRTF